MTENLKILVVDDEQSILDLFRDYLEGHKHYSVLTALDGLEALDIIKKEEINCCFTDLSMPKLGGLELTKEIQLHDNTIPVVVMTGHPSMDNAINTLKNGVVDFLTKPIQMRQIPRTIDRVRRERSLFVDNILLRDEAEKNKKLLKVNRELQQKIEELQTFNLIMQQLDRVTSSKDLFDMLVTLSGEVTYCDESLFCVYTHAMKKPAIITSFVRNNDKKITDVGHIDEKIFKKIRKDKMPILMEENHGSDNIIAIPLKIKTKIFGILIALMKGNERRFVEKDLFSLNFMAEKASSLIENLALYENIYENLLDTLYAFVEAIEAKDPYTKQHSARVTDYAVTIARAFGCEQDELGIINASGNLHDIGKIGVPDKILLKPGKLTDDEFEVIKKHPIIGGNIIGHFGMWLYEQKIVKHHHERWDGNGYPDGLRGEEIPFLSRILTVADVYDALTSDRSYRKSLSNDVAVGIIKENRGSQFDPKIVDAFLKLYEQGNMNPPF